MLAGTQCFFAKGVIRSTSASESGKHCSVRIGSMRQHVGLEAAHRTQVNGSVIDSRHSVLYGIRKFCFPPETDAPEKTHNGGVIYGILQ